MATTRKRSSGFTPKEVEAPPEQEIISGLLDEIATEMFETISRIEGEGEDEKEVVAPPPVHVIRTLDPPPVKTHPKRHPRNVPRFSDSK